jgi:hypothetical protein
MNHIKVWENFENREVKIENGFFHRFKGYTIVHLNGWLNGEQIFDLPIKFKRLNLSNLFLQKLADLLGREIRNPQEDEEIMKFSPPKPFTVNFWEYRRDLPFFPQSDSNQVN